MPPLTVWNFGAPFGKCHKRVGHEDVFNTGKSPVQCGLFWRRPVERQAMR